MTPRTRRFTIGLVALVYGLATLACSSQSCSPAPAPSSKPVVTITAPVAGAQVKVGETITVQATAMDAAGVSRVELWVDNALVETQNLPSPQPTAAVTLKWVAAPAGAHALMVRATNAAGTTSDPAVISVLVTEGAVAPPTPTTPTVTPPPTVPPPTSPAGCQDNAAFVKDVTIPDGTAMTTGTPFDKTWRVKNTGTCTWDGYELVFMGGEQMSAPARVAVPATAPGKEADITVKMTAPRSAGNYTGQWRLHDKAGKTLGPTLVVVIKVSAAPPPVTLPKADLEIVSMTIPGQNKLKLFVRNNRGDELVSRVVSLECAVSEDPGGQVGQTLITPVERTISVKSGQTIEVDIGELALDLTQHSYEIKVTIGPKPGDPNTYEETNPANNSNTATWQKQGAALPKADLEATSIWGNANTGYKLGLWVRNNGPEDLSGRTVEIIVSMSWGTGNEIYSALSQPIQKTYTAQVGQLAMILYDEGPTIDTTRYWYKISITVQAKADDANSYEETDPSNNTRREEWSQQP